MSDKIVLLAELEVLRTELKAARQLCAEAAEVLDEFKQVQVACDYPSLVPIAKDRFTRLDEVLARLSAAASIP